MFQFTQFILRLLLPLRGRYVFLWGLGSAQALEAGGLVPRLLP
jgi:hypothetical protein